MAVGKAKGSKKDTSWDFVPTISDSDEDIPDLDEDDDKSDEESSAFVKQKPQGKSKKNGEKKKKKASAESAVDAKEEEINPDFFFSVDDESSALSEFQGWDFVGDKKEGTDVRKEVDLDGIIRRKGGLVKKVHVASDSEEDEEDEEENVAESGDEEELAMDGFGMGSVPSSKKDTETEDAKEDKPSDAESSSSEDEEKEEETMQPASDDDDNEEDAPEEIAKFYAPEDEGENAKKQVHKTFNSLSLSRPVLKGLAALGYVKPSPIQSAAIPIALLGKDIIAGAVTGSGKTAAFMIPIIERLLYKPAKVASTRVIVLTPTRELAIQISDVTKKIAQFVTGITFGLAVGGLNLKQQEQQLKTRPDIVIATPGRFIDHIRNSASFNVDSVEILVMDEADRMLEDGFQDELNEIMTLLPTRRQTLLFSATMNSKIKQLISLSLKKPVRVMIDPPKQAANKLVQEFVRIRSRDQLKPALLYNLVRKLDGFGQKRIVVFVARKETAHRLRIILGLLGQGVGELHGSLTQEQRLDSVNKFKSLEVPILVCTDLASRGLDIPKIEVVINYDMPKSYEIYLHRVGRTARAGREGRSITFVGESTLDRSIVRSAIKSTEEATGRGKALGRNVDWIQVEETNKLVEKMDDTIEDILSEEKQEKEILRAEMELKKGENLLKYKEEIKSRPKRTWFQTEKEKKNAKVAEALAKTKKGDNSKKRKRMEALEDSSRSYKKTQKDRSVDQDKAYKKQRYNNKSKKGGKRK